MYNVTLGFVPYISRWEARQSSHAQVPSPCCVPHWNSARVQKKFKLLLENGRFLLFFTYKFQDSLFLMSFSCLLFSLRYFYGYWVSRLLYFLLRGGMISAYGIAYTSGMCSAGVGHLFVYTRSFDRILNYLQKFTKLGTVPNFMKICSILHLFFAAVIIIISFSKKNFIYRSSNWLKDDPEYTIQQNLCMYLYFTYVILVYILYTC